MPTSWIEIWFPEQGWVKFDPTPRRQADNPGLVNTLGFDPRNYIPIPDDVASDTQNQVNNALLGPPLDLLDQIGDAPTPDALIPALETPSSGRIPTAARILVGLMAVASIVPAFKWWRRRRRLAQLRTGDISAAWNEIIDQLADLGATVPASATPNEVAAATDPVMEPLALTYGKTAYGPEAPISEARLQWVENSYLKTEMRLRERYPRLRRVWRWFNVKSLRSRQN